jgi:hypothetical protein
LNFTVQADLVFPRNDSVYQPVYPFPIVFALSNFSRAWKYMPMVAWELTKYDPTSRQAYFANREFAGWNRNGTVPNWGAQPDKYLSIHWSHSPSNYNDSYWRLEWSFYVGKDDCLDGPDEKSKGSTGRIFFQTSNLTGIMPNLMASGPCPLPLYAVGITGENKSDEKCPLVSTPPPAPSCGFPVDKLVVDQVAKAMVDVSGCKNTTWPGGTGVGYRCSNSVETTSKGSRLERSSFALVVSLVGLLSALEWI